MLSMPFNSSTPVLYYNRDAFEKAGSTPRRRRRPGPEVGNRDEEAEGRRLCLRLHHGWQSWVQIENFSAWHNVPDRHQGQRLCRTRHRTDLQQRRAREAYRRLADWQKSKIFDYGGRRSDSGAEVL